MVSEFTDSSVWLTYLEITCFGIVYEQFDFEFYINVFDTSIKEIILVVDNLAAT